MLYCLKLQNIDYASFGNVMRRQTRAFKACCETRFRVLIVCHFFRADFLTKFVYYLLSSWWFTFLGQFYPHTNFKRHNKWYITSFYYQKYHLYISCSYKNICQNILEGVVILHDMDWVSNPQDNFHGILCASPDKCLWPVQYLGTGRFNK